MFLSCRDAAQLMDSVSLWLNFVLDAVKRNLLCGFCAHASSWQNVPFRGKRCLIDSINRKRLTAPHLILSKKYHTLHHLTEFNLKLSLMLYWKAGKTHLKVQSATSELQPLFPAWNVDTACRAMWRSWGLTVQVSATAKTPGVAVDDEAGCWGHTGEDKDEEGDDAAAQHPTNTKRCN